MSHHFSSPSGTIGGAVSCGRAPRPGASPRYELGTATVGLLYLGPTVQPVVRRATLSKTMPSFMSITLRRRDFGSSKRFAPLACIGPLLDEIKDGWDEENTDEACGQHSSDDGCPHDLACHSSSAGSGPQGDRTQNEGERSH